MIKLQSGRTIRVQSINQEQTYGGLLLGRPRKRFNDEIIERSRQKADAKPWQPVILIDPVRKPGPIGIPDPGDQRWGPPELLPEVTCYCLFESERLGKRAAHYSQLMVVWFQESFAFPIDAAVMENIRGLDWDTLAADFVL